MTVRILHIVDVFANREEAVAVGSETSQIVHNTLKWIIRKQGAFLIR